MVRQKPDEVKKEVEEQVDSDYGEDLSSAPNPDKLAQKGADGAMEEFIGNKPKGTAAQEIDRDEKAIRSKPINDPSDDNNSDPVSDDDSHDPTMLDPYEMVKDKDIKKPGKAKK